ncbi:hypothetical protein TrVE_jg14474 [Triparma verrucosa]|uniref:Histone-lysine N-methyltransferase, H3 lysine-79 specific n=1 Tax=Triparma verrucosa TaxID=1606542 RepID=A0A9W7DNB7_9STRA|nr:hypothetical protein TrVE_jg14474 [Triparma verrucosa]
MSDSDSDASIEPPTQGFADSTLTATEPPPNPLMESLKQEIDLFDKLYGKQRGFSETYGKEISRAERKREGYISTTLTYGEIKFETFAELMNILKGRHGAMKEDGGVFVDIGCGIGKPLFGAALLHKFDKIVGIEILEDLYKVCVETMQHWTKHVKPVLGEERTQDMQFSFLNNDFLIADWSDADIVFMNSTCFNRSLMIDLSAKGKALAPGTIVVTTTKRMVGPAFDLVEELQMEESWGDATVYIQKRVERS